MDTDYKLLDLTHELSGDSPSWDSEPGFRLSINTDYQDKTPPDLFRTQTIVCGAGMGTHVDSPAHMILGGRTCDQLTLAELAADCVMIDVSLEADENYFIMPEVIEKFEKEHGRIAAKTLVIFYTGWDRYWGNPEKYRNNHKFPSVHVSTAQTLLKRDIAGLGIDTLSSDTGAAGFPVHAAVLGADKYLIENIANANRLPPAGAKVLALPIKIKGATEAPVRLLALI